MKFVHFANEIAQWLSWIFKRSLICLKDDLRLQNQLKEQKKALEDAKKVAAQKGPLSKCTYDLKIFWILYQVSLSGFEAGLKKK